MEKLFKLRANGTTVRTELLAGLTTFMTMAYIIALNPNLLTDFGRRGGEELWNGVFMATCIASAIGTICMGLLANKPFAMAPGMGINTFFAFVAANIMSVTGFSYLRSFRSALVIILIEGIVFVVMSLLNIREKIVEGIPMGIRLGIAPAVGMMLMNIGFGSNAGVRSGNGGTFYVMRDFFGALTSGQGRITMGDAYESVAVNAAVMLLGLFFIIFLEHRKVKGAVFLGILFASCLYWGAEALLLGVNPFEPLMEADFTPPFKDLAETTLFKLDFAGLAEIGIVAVTTLVISFIIVDMFDTIGTLVGTASRANMLDKNGNMPGMKQALLSDAVGTVSGALTGTSTVTTFVESASGVAVGGRTGLTAVTAGILFLLCVFISPLVSIIPAPATSAALIYVGLLMMSNLKRISFEDPADYIPEFIMLLAIPVSGSIGHGIGLAIISYTVIRLCTGKVKQVPVLTWVLTVIFLIKFFVPI